MFDADCPRGHTDWTVDVDGASVDVDVDTRVDADDKSLSPLESPRVLGESESPRVLLCPPQVRYRLRCGGTRQ